MLLEMNGLSRVFATDFEPVLDFGNFEYSLASWRHRT